MLTDDGSRLCVRLMSRTYGHILDRIEQRDYDVFSGRAFVPLAAKLGIAGGTLLGFGREAEAPSGRADAQESSGAAVLESSASRD
jgi:phytoene synthase